MRGIALAALATILGACAPDMRLWEVTRVRGELTHTASGYELKICGSSGPYAVKDLTRGDLPGIWRTLGAQPSSVLFVEAVVEQSDNSHEVRIQEIRRAQAGEGRGCDEDWSYEYRAHGNEPFWSVTVKSDSIVFEQPDEPHRIAFPYAAPSSGTYRSVAAGDTLVLTLEEHRCQDGMSGFIFPLTAEARFRGRVLHGCASEGAPK
jgi:uncharacterized membrane protein